MSVKINNKLLLYIFLEELDDKYKGFRSNLHQNSWNTEVTISEWDSLYNQLYDKIIIKQNSDISLFNKQNQ